jgi:hypothetical protein
MLFPKTRAASALSHRRRHQAIDWKITRFFAHVPMEFPLKKKWCKNTPKKNVSKT